MAEPIRTMVEILYYLVPHLEFFDLRDLMIHNWTPVRFGICVKATGYALLYVALFLMATCAVFRRKSVTGA